MDGRGVAARADGKCVVGKGEQDHAEMHEDADFSDLPVHFQPLETDRNVHSVQVERPQGSLMDTDSQYLDPGLRLTPNYSSPVPPSHNSPQPASYPNSSSTTYTSPPPTTYTSPAPPHGSMDMGYNTINNPALYPVQNLSGGHGDGLGNTLPYGTNYHSGTHSMSAPGMYGTSSMNSHFDAGDGSGMAGPSGKGGHQGAREGFQSADVGPGSSSGGGGLAGRESEFGPISSSGTKLCSAGVNTVESGSFGHNGQNDKQYHPCPYCSKLFTRRDHMKRHIKIHIRGEPVKCVECQSWFPCKMDLTHHLLDCHHVLVFECNGCSKGFFEAKYLTEHLHNKHDLIVGPDGTGRMIRAPTSKLPPLPQALQLPYRCGICTLSFVHEAALNKHMLCHCKRVSTSSHSLPASSLPMTPSSLTEVRDTQVMSQIWAQAAMPQEGGVHGSINNGGNNLLPLQGGYGSLNNGNGMGMPAFTRNQILQPVKCEPSEGEQHKQREGIGDVSSHLTDLLLNRAFQQHTDMALRMMQCTGSDDFMCGVCGKAFIKPQELKAHLRKHSSHHRFACIECGASFASSSNLVRHQRTHSGEKPFKCSLCSSAFTHKGALINHERIHTGERPYVCELCDAAFARVDALTRHKRTHKENRIKEEEDGNSDVTFAGRI